MIPAIGDTTGDDAVLDRAYARILRISVVLAVAGIIAGAVIFNPVVAAGFALGALATILNFVWLHRVVEALVDRMLSPGGGSSRARMTLSFLGRYALVALIAYAIFKGSSQAFRAFLIALPLPILAAMCEGAYEAFLNIKDSGSSGT